jgi:hypothetical protein
VSERAGERFDMTATAVRSWRGRIWKALRVAAFFADGDDMSAWPFAVRTVVRDRRTGRTIYQAESDNEEAGFLGETLRRDLKTLDADAFLEKWDVQPGRS